MAIKIFQKYTPRANAADANYPEGSLKNETVPSANDGTPLDQDWGNDYEGFTAALLAATNTPYSGNPDTLVSSDRANAVAQFIKNRAPLAISVRDNNSPSDGQTYNCSSAPSQPSFTSYQDGIILNARFESTNTVSNPVINIDGVGNATLTNVFETGLPNGAIIAAQEYILEYHVSSNVFRISQGISAEENISGVGRIASQGTMDGGVEGTNWVTSKTFKDTFATTTRRGTSFQATQAEVDSGSPSGNFVNSSALHGLFTRTVNTSGNVTEITYVYPSHIVKVGYDTTLYTPGDVNRVHTFVVPFPNTLDFVNTSNLSNQAAGAPDRDLHNEWNINLTNDKTQFTWTAEWVGAGTQNGQLSFIAYGT